MEPGKKDKPRKLFEMLSTVMQLGHNGENAAIGMGELMCSIFRIADEYLLGT